MGFITDEQTLADLNLLGKYKAGSMFNLFNRVKTRGGELLLERYFKTPLTDAELINQRAAQIKTFQSLAVELELTTDQAELAAVYIAESRPANPFISTLNCYKQRLQEMLYHADKFYIQQQHILAVQEVLLSASKLLGLLQKQLPAEHPCKVMQDELEAIVQAPGLKRLKVHYPYTLQQTAHCQYLFRNRYRIQLERLLELLYAFDVLLSVAKVAKDKGFSFAKAKQDSVELIAGANLRHPALHQAIGNDMVLSKAENLMFLTGANMAGKSTWMKTLGVSYYLAHMGFPVAANWMHFKVMEGILTSINVPDDISQGWSHFYAEVMRVKQVAKAVSSGKQLFILFDELFKGTNVKDAYDATLVVTEKLSRYKRCAFVISTHIIEVAEELKNTDGIQFCYMPTVMEGAIPRYTYKMEEGITEDRQGMIIIQNERILEIIGEEK
jgi:DNA mismatch repair protein MutS